MKKICIILLLMSAINLVGCGAGMQNGSVDLKGIALAISTEIAKNEGITIDEKGNLAGYAKVNLGSDEEFATVSNLPIKKEAIKQGVIMQPIVNVNSDKYILIEAAKGKEADVEKGLEQIKASELESWSTYLPDQYQKVKDTIITNEGSVYLYVTNDNPENIKKIFDDFINKTN